MSVRLSVDLESGHVTTGAMMEVTELDSYLKFCGNSRGTRKTRNGHTTVKFRGIADDCISFLWFY